MLLKAPVGDPPVPVDLRIALGVRDTHAAAVQSGMCLCGCSLSLRGPALRVSVAGRLCRHPTLSMFPFQVSFAFPRME